MSALTCALMLFKDSVITVVRDNCSSNTDVEDTAARALSELQKIEEEGRAPTVAETGVLLENAQFVWNATVLNPWPASAPCSLKATVREVATHAFLVANNCFTTQGGGVVRAKYIRSHRLDAERCVLMCLKTSKALAQVQEHQRATQLLRHASSIVTLTSGSQSSSHQQDLSLEVDFALVVACWEAHSYAAAVSAARELALVSHTVAPYREALVRFIFTIAEGDSASTGGEERSQEAEEALRSLLAISLRLQVPDASAAPPAAVKGRTLLSTTHLHIALSYLRSGDSGCALTAVSQARSVMDSVEALVIQLRAHASLHDGPAALATLRLLMQHRSASSESISIEEFFALAKLLSECDGTIADGVIAVVEEKRAQEELLLPPASKAQDSREVALRDFGVKYISLLLHIGSPASIERVLAYASKHGEERARCPHARFFFCGLCSIAANHSVTSQARVQALVAALEYVNTIEGSSVASAEEVECVLLTLSEECFSLYEVSEGSLDSLHPAAAAFAEHAHCCTTEHSLVYRCELEVLLPTEGVDPLRTLGAELSSLQEDVAVAVAGSLVNFFAAHTITAAFAGRTAQILLECHGPLVSPNNQLAFAKVWALALLASSCDMSPLPDSVSAIANAVCPVLSNCGTEDSAMIDWWCRWLWHASDAIAEAHPSVALHVCDMAISIFKTNFPTGRDALLTNRLLYALETEYELFVSGQDPVLSVDALRTYTAMIPECERDLSTAATTIGALATAECRLRCCSATERSHEQSALIVQARELAEAGVCAADLEALGSAAVAAAYANEDTDCAAALRRTGAALQLAAAQAVVDAGNRGVDVWLMCYKAYTMCEAPEERGAVMEQVKKLSGAPDCMTNTEDNGVSHASCSTETEAEEEAHSTMTMLAEYFAIEAWNTTVHYNAAKQHDMAHRCLTTVRGVCEFLPNRNITRSTIEQLSQNMPLV